METKDLNQAAKGAEKKNEDKKNGKAAKIAGMAGGMAAAAGAGVAGTMAAQGINTPEDEWVEDPVVEGGHEQHTVGETTEGEEHTEDEVFDINDIRIDDEDDDSEIVEIEEEEIIEESEQPIGHEPIGSHEEEELIDIEIDPVNPTGDEDLVVDVMYGGPGGWEDIEPDMYGGPVDLPEDDPEDYLAGADLSDDLLI